MALIQNPTPTRKLQRALRLTSLPDAVLAPELVGVFIVEDLSEPLSEESRGCMGSATVVGVTSQFSFAALVRVGAPASYDMVCTAVNFSAIGSPSSVIVGLPTAGVVGLTVSTDISWVDFSLPGQPSSQIGFDTALALPAHRRLAAFSMPANENIRLPLNVRLGTFSGPGGLNQTAIIVASLFSDTTIRVNFEWTEETPLG